jgi:hypothetical protein
MLANPTLARNSRGDIRLEIDILRLGFNGKKYLFCVY